MPTPGSKQRVPHSGASVPRDTPQASEDRLPPAGPLLSDSPAGTIPVETRVSPSVLRRDSQRRRLLAVADASAVLAALVPTLLSGGSVRAQDWSLLAVAPVWILMHKIAGLYDRDANLIHKATLDETPRLVQGALLGSSLLFLLVPLALPGSPLTRGHAIEFGLAVAIAMPLLRTSARAWLTRHQTPERLVIVGSGGVTRMLERKLAAHPEYGVELVGRVADSRRQARSRGADAPLLGPASDFEAVCRRHCVERAVIAFGNLDHEELFTVIRASRQLGVRITVVPRLFEAIGHAVEQDDVEGLPLLGLRGLTRTTSSLLLKRAIDIGLSAGALVLLSPFLFLLAATIRLTSRGPAFFPQERIGQHGRPFEMLKFRTMVADAEAHKADVAHLNQADAPMFKIRDDPRITPVGRVLRRTSLDEVPQLWNVLRGEMSLVGPRPLIPHESAHILGRYRDRLHLTPGLTGPWQVLGRTTIPFDEMVRLDCLYVAEWSLWNDIKLLLRTAPVVLFGRGA